MTQADEDARRRQAIQKISTCIMTLTHLSRDGLEVATPEGLMYQIEDMLEDLIRARYLLVEHEGPDGILDELASL
jgi:hypothetical protein